MKKRIIGLFYERCPNYCLTRRWMASAYFDYCTNQSLMVLWPFHYVVMFVHWIGYRWDRHRHKRSWIDRMVNEAVLQTAKDQGWSK